MIVILDRPGVIDAAPTETGWTEAELEALVNALTRRRVLIGGAALAALAGRAVAGAQTPEATTRVIDTAMGDVEIPVNPQRVVCSDTYSMSDFYDIGFHPVGVWAGQESNLRTEYLEVYEATAKISTPAYELDLEAIALLRPDLIVGITASWALDTYEQLTAMAPTVLFDYEVPNAWMQLADQFADAIGRTSDLDELKRQYRERAAAIRSTYPDTLAGTRWGIAFNGSENWFLYFPDSNGGAVLSEAGVQFVSAAVGKTGGAEQRSYEQLDQLADADVLLIYADNFEGRPAEWMQGLLDQPAWKSLKAVQAGHVYASAFVVPDSYRAAMGLLDDVEAILRTLEGRD